MAIKLAQHLDKTVPGVVRAVVARRSSMLEHQANAVEPNAEKTQRISRTLTRIHNNGSA